MSRNQGFCQEDAESFMRLYKKLLDSQYEKMGQILNELPTQLIEDVFSDTSIHKEEDNLLISFGYKQVGEKSRLLTSYYDLKESGKLEQWLSDMKPKMKLKEIGVRKK